MKKLLSLLAVVSMTASSSALVISCGNKKSVDPEGNKIDLSNLNIKENLNKIDLNVLNSILDVNESIIKALNQTYDNKYDLKLNEDIKLALFKDTNLQNPVLSYNDLINQNYIYIKFIANINSNKVKNESVMFEFEIISKKQAKFNLKNVQILSGLNKFDLNNLTSINQIKENAVKVLNAALNDILGLKIKDDVSVSIFLDPQGNTATNDFNDIIDKENVYVQFKANPYSTKIENETDINKFIIIKKQATNVEIANAVSTYIKKQITAIENTDVKGVSKEYIINEIKSKFPNELIINNSKVKDFDINNINVFLKDNKEFYENTAIAYIEYKNVRSEIDLSITISSDPFVINSKKISNLATHYNEYLSQTSLVNVDEINDDVWKNLINIGITKEKFSLIGSIIKNIDGINEGQYQYRVLDSSGKELINYNFSDENNKNTFNLKISTNKLKNYIKMSETLNEFSNNEEPSSSLRFISLFDFLPMDIFEKFNNPTAISDLLKSITLGNFVDWFFEPTGKYANLMPRSMPKLDDQGIMKNENKDFWNYINTIANDFKSKGIDVINELKADYQTEINGYKATISIDIYKLILNIMPDLIHFHNYIIYQQIEGQKPNYLLLFIKYLLDDVKDYNVVTDTASFKDNFLMINKNTKNLKTNFDSLLHNMVDPFSSELNSDSNKIVTSKISPPINVVIHTNILGVNDQRISWEALADSQVPSTILFKDLINRIIENPAGKNINENLDLKIEITIKFLGFLPIHIKSSSSMNLSSLHVKELKSLIKNDLNFGSSFDNSVVTTEKGRLFLIGKNKNNEWVEIHSLDDLNDINDVKFWFKDFKFKITDSTENLIYVTQSMSNFYLEL